MSLRSVYLFFLGSLMILAVVSVGGVQYWRDLALRPPVARRAVPAKTPTKTTVQKKCFFVKTPAPESRPVVQTQYAGQTPPGNH